MSPSLLCVNLAMRGRWLHRDILGLHACKVRAVLHATNDLLSQLGSVGKDSLANLRCDQSTSSGWEDDLFQKITSGTVLRVYLFAENTRAGNSRTWSHPSAEVTATQSMSQSLQVSVCKYCRLRDRESLAA